MAVRIGELLLKEKRITPAQLQEALNYQKTNGGKLGYNLVKLTYVRDEEITALLDRILILGERHLGHHRQVADGAHRLDRQGDLDEIGEGLQHEGVDATCEVLQDRGRERRGSRLERLRGLGWSCLAGAR